MRNWSLCFPHELWRTREEARQQLVARGPDRVVRLLLEEWEHTGDPRVRDRIAFILHPWGVFAIGDRVVPVLKECVNFNRHLREALPEIRSAPESALQEPFQEIVHRFGILMDVLKMEIDGELVRFRDHLVSSVIHLQLLLNQGERARAIGAVAEMSRKIAARVEAHGDLDQDGLPTSWELEHELDPAGGRFASRSRRRRPVQPGGVQAEPGSWGSGLVGGRGKVLGRRRFDAHCVQNR